jgi:fatty acid desaturase
MAATLSLRPDQELNTPALMRRVNQLRTIDNVTNWFYLVREYLVLGTIVGLTIALYMNWESWGLAWAWNVPVTLLAIVLIGAGQHRLTNLAHEGSHYMLFRHRLLNELVSDWFCLFPMWSSTHQYRLQHLAHHQYVNDPERDPDVTQMTASGHRFRFPMEPHRFVWECVIKQFLWLPSLVHYIRIRARYSATGGGSGPYQSKGPRSRVLILVGILYLAAQAGTLTGLTILGDPLLLAVVPAVMLASVLTFYFLVPQRLYLKSLVKPDIPPRWMAILRITYLTLVLSAVAWLTQLTGLPWALYYFLLWLVPLFTTFSFFMIMRQVVQHGNASRDRLTNTRIFHVNRLIQLAVFPLGMDYHLPHHLFPMVPHFRLKQLHSLLMETAAYREHATVVEGYFFPREKPPTHPTVLDLMARERDAI